MNLLIAILGFLVAIGVLVVVHEYGHFAVARLAGVKVLRFSIGFGKPLLRRVSASGVEWTLGWLPLGGYVKMLDERDAEGPIPAADLPRAFNRQPVAKRIAVVAAGPIANFLLAIALFAVIYATGVVESAAILAPPPSQTVAARAGFDAGDTVTGMRVADGQGVLGQARPVRSWEDLRWQLLDAALAQRTVHLLATSANGHHYEYPLDLSHLDPAHLDENFLATLGLVPGGVTASVAAIEAGSPAAAAGLAVGDVIRAIDNTPVTGVKQIIEAVRSHSKQSLTLDVMRGNQMLRLPIVPAPSDSADGGQPAGRIGAALGEQLPSVNVRYGPLDALRLGAGRTWEISTFSLRMFGHMLVGQASLRNLSGPVTIADYAGKSARMGVSAFLSFLALVSISLGVLNLLPIPVLDGGHLLYYAVEAVTGRAVSERWQAFLQRAGLVCIFALSAIALFNDLARLIHF